MEEERTASRLCSQNCVNQCSVVSEDKIECYICVSEECDGSGTLLCALLTREKKNRAKVLVKKKKESSSCLLLGKKGKPETGLKQKKNDISPALSRLECAIELRHSRTAYRNVNPKTFFIAFPEFAIC